MTDERKLGTALFGEEDAKQAVAMAKPSMIQAMKDGRVHRKACHAVVMDPSAPKDKPRVLYEESVILEEADWKGCFHSLGNGKGRTSHRLGMSTEKAVTKCPHLLMPGDPKYPGGVCEDGISVGVSGFKGYWDHAFAQTIANYGNAICKAKMDAIQKDDSLDVIPGDN